MRRILFCALLVACGLAGAEPRWTPGVKLPANTFVAGSDGGAAAAAVVRALVSGDFAANIINGTAIADGAITNVDINAAAAIDDTKLATIATAGKVSDTALSANVPLKNASNTFSSTNTFSADITFTGGANALTVGVPNTPVATADSIFAASATTQIPVVIQRKVGQTAPLLEIQNQVATPMSWFDSNGYLNISEILASNLGFSVRGFPNTGSGVGGTVDIFGGNSGPGATGNGGAILVRGGQAVSTNGNGGAVAVDGGEKSGAGTGGAVTIGTTNAESVTIGRTTKTVTLPGSLSTGNTTIQAGAAAGVPLTLKNSAGNTIMEFGTGAATNVDTTSVYIGTDAGEATTIPSGDDYNTFIGYRAGKSNTLGRDSTAVGSDALYSYTTNGQGTQDGLNTAIGSQALLALVSGNSNVSVGQKSGTNLLGSTNSFYGTKSGASWTTGTGNVVIGEQAASSGLADITGDYNVIVGQGAMATLGAKNYNTVGGRYAFRLQGIADDNTGWGYAVGENNLTGTRNSYFGLQTGLTATVANDVSGFGWKVLEANTGGTNSGFGAAALRANTDAIGNNAFGYRSQTTVTTGGQNCSFGNDSLRLNVSGIRNCAFGNFALEAATAGGGQSSAFGYRAGVGLTSGEGNSFLGADAGALITTGNFNVFIGLGSGGVASNVPNSTNQTFISGHPDVPILDVYFGGGMLDASPPSYTINGTGNNTVNGAGANINIAGGKGNGTGVGGSIVLQTAATGTTLRDVVTVDSTAQVKLGIVSTTTGTLALAHASSANLTTLSAGNATEAAAYVLPTAKPVTETRTLQSTTTGTMSWGVGFLHGSATLNFGNILAGASEELTITVTGAATSDPVTIGLDDAAIDAGTAAEDGMAYVWWVSAANTVTLRATNRNTVTAVDLPSGTFKATVLKQP